MSCIVSAYPVTNYGGGGGGSPIPPTGTRTASLIFGDADIVTANMIVPPASGGITWKPNKMGFPVRGGRRIIKILTSLYKFQTYNDTSKLQFQIRYLPAASMPDVGEFDIGKGVLLFENDIILPNTAGATLYYIVNNSTANEEVPQDGMIFYCIKGMTAANLVGIEAAIIVQE